MPRVDRIKEFFADPWKATTAGLAAALLVTLVVLIPRGDAADDPGAGTTTTTTRAGGSTTPSDPGQQGEGFRGLVAAKIDNAPLARPQVGIGQVPLLVEYMAEGGITRFIAVTDGSFDGIVGPVRSLRPVDADLFPLLSPTLASTGGQSFVIREIDAGGTIRVEPETSAAFMIANRPAPHHYFLSLSTLLEEVPDFNPADPPFPSGTLTGGSSADAVAVPAWDLSWSFEDGVYSRAFGGEPFAVMGEIDGDTVPLTHDVMVFIQVGQRSAGYTDGAGAPVFAYDVIGGGDMVAFHDGQATAGSWVRLSHTGAFQLFDESGNPVGIPDGRVYVAFLPQGVDVEY